jgi:hypothetical protein
MKNPRVALIWICILAAALFFWGRLWDAWQWNWINLCLIKGQAVITTSDCSHIWLVGMAAGQRGDLSGQRQAFMQALGCSRIYLSLVQDVLPENKEMARLAAQYYPESS